MVRSIALLLLLWCVSTLRSVQGQSCPNNDCDEDGLNDALEAAIAERFAPEWRFNRHQPGDGSSQNNNEKNYPMSVEKWFDEQAGTGDLPTVKFGFNDPQPVDPVTGVQPPDVWHSDSRTITDIRDLCSMTNPFNDERLDSRNVIATDYDEPMSIFINGFPRDLLGDPDGFPTYYHCYERYDTVYIAYMLFYPYNEKAMPLDFGDHRGDWKGVSMQIGGITPDQLSDPMAAENAVINYIWYGGHGKKKYIRPSSEHYLSVGLHPRVFVSRGGHGCWPVPGEWHNYDVENSLLYGVVGGALLGLLNSVFLGIFGGYGIDDLVDDADDFFRGDGLFVQAWSEGRQLINLGESAHDDYTSSGTPVEDMQGIPLNGWSDFIGNMGSDFFGGDADSPRPPYSKGEWRAGITGPDVYEWTALVDANPSYLTPFAPAPFSSNAGWESQGTDPVAILWAGEKFDGEPWVVSGPGVFPDISELVYNEIGGQQYYIGFSVLFAGKLRIKLYPEYDFGGSPVTITRSKHKVYGTFRSMIIEDAVTGETCDVTVDASATGFEDGSPASPYNTLSDGLTAAPTNGVICLVSGTYAAPATIQGPLKLRSAGGTVTIGE